MDDKVTVATRIVGRWITAKNLDSFFDGSEASVVIGKQLKCFLLRVPSGLFGIQLLLQFFCDQCFVYANLAQSGFTRMSHGRRRGGLVGASTGAAGRQSAAPFKQPQRQEKA